MAIRDKKTGKVYRFNDNQGTIKALNIGSSLIGSFSSIASSISAGNLRRIFARHNANMSEISADLSKFKAEELEKRLGEKEQRELAASRAAAVGEGFALDSGTNLDIDGDIIRARAIDRAVIRASGGLEEARFEIEAIEQRGRADIAKVQTQAETVQTLFGTTTDLMERFI